MTAMPNTVEFAAVAAHNAVATALDAAVRRTAPLWPLDRFVAVNPFLGFADLPFGAAAAEFARASGAAMLMPRAFYAAAIRDGRIQERDLAAAASLAPEGLRSATALREAAQAADPAPPSRLPTVAAVAQLLTGEDWPAFAADRISAFAAAWFDRGQGAWRLDRSGGLFAAWLRDARVDRTPDALGIKVFRAALEKTPENATEAATAALTRLGVPDALHTDYLFALAQTGAGWSGFARFRLWEAELHGGDDADAVELLAVRVVIEAALAAALDARGHAGAWRAAIADARTAAPPEADPIALVLQSAYEHAWRRQAFEKIAAAPPTPAGAPSVQAVFCIDVRSEVFRRALETAAPDIETMGFAGFFGLAVDVAPLGSVARTPYCPVLLKPGFAVCEAVGDADAAGLAETRAFRFRAAGAWKRFKHGAASAFGFVETMGLAYLPKLISDSLGATRPAPNPKTAGLTRDEAARLAPTIAPSVAGSTVFGLTSAQRLSAAEAVLRAMSMTSGFARIVLLAGHGAATVNNPHAAGLDCGACGGQSGEINAQVAVAILNDAAVREGLAHRSIVVPAETLFVAGLHDTTTDAVTLYGIESAPATHREDIRALQAALAAAGRAARAERAHRLSLEKGMGVESAIAARAKDWSQVRPEWGLAGCAAFIAAPRARTKGKDFGGRTFLHSYAWREDEGYGVLELILTAPVIVASWINLQYYGSTVDPKAFGAGDKTLHNVVGGVGVLEGHGGDLRGGLPLQSVHDGESWQHEPMRLAVVIEAPTEAMSAIIARHAGLRDLLDNEWVHLFAMDERGVVAWRYAGGGAWREVAG